jgi:glutaconate CoA-transferase subunit B
MSEPTVREAMAVSLARELRDGDVVVAGGVRSAVPMAAVFLAQRTHAPNIALVMGMGVVNPRPDRIWPSAGDPRYAEHCEGLVSMDDIFEMAETGAFDVAFYGGLQIDRHGNTNLTWVELGDRRVRGPGVANASLAVTVGRILLYAEHHDPRVFVPEVDVVTIPGHTSPQGRGATGGDGPASCTTPLGVFDFPAPDRTMAVRSLNGGVTAEQVRAATSFELGWPEHVPTTEPPNREELSALRALDPDGLLGS